MNQPLLALIAGAAFFSTNVNGSGFTPIREFDTAGSSFDPVWTSLRGVGSDLVAGPQLTLSEHGKYLLVAIDSDTGGSLYLVGEAIALSRQHAITSR